MGRNRQNRNKSAASAVPQPSPEHSQPESHMSDVAEEAVVSPPVRNQSTDSVVLLSPIEEPLPIIQITTAQTSDQAGSMPELETTTPTLTRNNSQTNLIGVNDDFDEALAAENEHNVVVQRTLAPPLPSSPPVSNANNN